MSIERHGSLAKVGSLELPLVLVRNTFFVMLDWLISMYVLVFREMYMFEGQPRLT